MKQEILAVIIRILQCNTIHLTSPALQTQWTQHYGRFDFHSLQPNRYKFLVLKETGAA